MSATRYDVVVIGGAIMGSSVAYFLTQLAPGLRIGVVEPDPTYALASTPRASGGARRLFSCPENVQMSQFSIAFIERFPTVMAVQGEAMPVDWRRQGYLFIVPPRGMEVLAHSASVQTAHGATVELMDRAALQRRFPSMFTGDLGGGLYSPDDGWCDPASLLQGFRKKASSLGVIYVRDRVTAMRRTGAAVTHAELASGHTLHAQAFVNATGAWAAQIGHMVGMPLPIAPLRRFEHYFTGHRRIEPLPYVKDLARLAFRPEGAGYSGGLVNSDEPRGFNFDVDHGYFDRIVWPALAHRFPPAFEGSKCHRTWAGLYDQCELDGNPVIGNWPGQLDNFYVVSGFSGHGMMHAPAAGRAIAELIVHGRFDTIDLARFGYARVLRATPYAEDGIL